MRRTCFFHAGCPDGFGAAWAVWRAWGDDADFRPRGHDDTLRAGEFVGHEVVFVDIAPPNDDLRELAERAASVVVLDHHASSENRFRAEPRLVQSIEADGHQIVFDRNHSGAVLAWRHFHPERPTPQLLRYVEDQDLWNWKMPRSEEVNAAIGSFPRRFDVWDELCDQDPVLLAEEGAPIVRANRIEVERALYGVHPISLGGLRVEAVNARNLRSSIGHELARRSAYGTACGVVYRTIGDRVDVSIYSIGDFDVARVAQGYGGGGHRNAAGFSLRLRRWLGEFL